MPKRTRDEADESRLLNNCTQVATIIVGEQKKEWSIPTDLLCFHSAYFRRALRGKFAEAEEQKVELRDTEPLIFELVVEWLYTHSIGMHLSYKTVTDMNVSFGKLLDAWLLADYLQITKLQNVLIRSMSCRVTELRYVPVKELNRVQGILGGRSPLYDWIMDVCAWGAGVYDEFITDCLDESALDILGQVCGILSSEVHSPDRFPFNDNYLSREIEDESEDSP
ncbi:hypothetical protein ACLOAV_010037 [Pseudogymnoascus australis]